MQSFLKAPNFNKKFFYQKPQDRYQEFCNEYAYYKQATLCDPKLNRQKLMEECLKVWKEVKKMILLLLRIKFVNIMIQYLLLFALIKKFSCQIIFIIRVILPLQNILPLIGFIDTTKIPKNVTSQHNAAEKINLATRKIPEYGNFYR